MVRGSRRGTSATILTLDLEMAVIVFELETLRYCWVVCTVGYSPIIVACGMSPVRETMIRDSIGGWSWLSFHL